MILCPLPLAPGHLHDVAQLELLCFPNEPWSENALAVLCEENAFGRVITDEYGHAIAYGGLTFAAGEGSITNIAVHPACRRQGLGRMIVTALIDAAKERSLTEIYLEVRPSNHPAIALYQSIGFFKVGTRKNFYRAPREDAMLMKWSDQP